VEDAVIDGCQVTHLDSRCTKPRHDDLSYPEGDSYYDHTFHLSPQRLEQFARAAQATARRMDALSDAIKEARIAEHEGKV
jgi:hypothetical protein